MYFITPSVPCAERKITAMKYHKKKLILAYAILIMMMLVILFISIKYPKNNLISWQMLIGTILATLFFVLAVMIWNKIYPKVSKISALYWICLLCFGISLFSVSIDRLDNYGAFIDYAQIYSAASDMASGLEISNGYYFKIYSNNLKPMLILSVLFKFADYLGVARDYPVLTISVLQTVITTWAVGYLLGKKYRFPVLVLFMACLPVWGMTSAFYTDTMSFGLSVIAMAFMKKALSFRNRMVEQKEGSRAKYNLKTVGYLVYVILAATCVVLAFAWKITAVIVLIACGIVLSLKFYRGLIRGCLPFLAFVAIFSVLFSCWTNSFKLAKEAKETANPIVSWIALGMVGDGSWSSNRDFIYNINELPSTKEKTEYSLQFIYENRAEFTNGHHIVQKISRNFANGNLGVYEFMYIEVDDGSLLWNMFSPWGKFYWRTSQYCFCYIAMIYFSFVLGMISSIIDIIKGIKPSGLLMICQISFLGIFLFLMIWEANNRQLYNQMPVFILGAMISMVSFVKKFEKTE